MLKNKIKNNIKFKEMNIKTSYPVIIDGKDISPRDYYSSVSDEMPVNMDFIPQEEVTADGVKVMTKYPVILDGTDISPRDYYSNVGGGTYGQLDLAAIAKAAEQYQKSGTSPSSKDQNKAKEKGLFWDKAKGAWQSFSNSPAGQTALQQIDAYLTARRDSKFGTSSGGGASVTTQSTADASAQPMSKGAKIALIAGGIVVAGLIVYAIVAGGKTQK